MASNSTSTTSRGPAARVDVPKAVVKEIATGQHTRRLTPTVTQEHVRKPSVDDILMEKKEKQLEMLGTGLHHKTLTPTTTQVHARLPSADDIQQEKATAAGGAAGAAGTAAGARKPGQGSPPGGGTKTK